MIASVVELSPQESADMFERVVRREMGLSTDEFLHRYDTGVYDVPDMDAVPGLVRVWMYLPAIGRS